LEWVYRVRLSSLTKRMKELIMKLLLIVNMNLNGLALLKMLSLMVNILIEIENYYSLNMKVLAGLRPVLIM
jgi:uncharacterized membrane protein YqjE